MQKIGLTMDMLFKNMVSKQSLRELCSKYLRDIERNRLRDLENNTKSFNLVLDSFGNKQDLRISLKLIDDIITLMLKHVDIDKLTERDKFTIANLILMHELC